MFVSVVWGRGVGILNPMSLTTRWRRPYRSPARSPGAICQFRFRWIYYCHNSNFTGKKTGKTHLCVQWQLHYHWGNVRVQSRKNIDTYRWPPIGPTLGVAAAASTALPSVHPTATPAAHDRKRNGANRYPCRAAFCPAPMCAQHDHGYIGKHGTLGPTEKSQSPYLL